MKSDFKAALLGSVALFSLSGASALAQEAQEVKFTLLVASDLYEMAVDEERGGFSRAAAVARDVKANNENVIYVFPGDTISPSLFSGIDKGAHVIELLNLEAPDVFVPGNHEYDFGEEIFNTRMRDLNSTLLAANMRNADGSIVEGFADTTMYEFGPLKIGVLGLTLDTTASVSSPGTLQFAAAVETLETNADALREAGADIVVAVTHSDWAQDQEMINTGAVDFILSGHDHDLRIADNGHTVFAEGAADAANLVALDVTAVIEGEGEDRDVEWHTNFRIIDTAPYAVPEDYAQLVAAYEAELAEELDVSVGIVATPLDSRRQSVRTGETAIGNLITDAMRDAVGADVALTNGGGIRAGREYEPNYAITRRDILTELPFGNVTVKLELTGADIIAALENGLSRYPETAGGFPHVSGMSFVFNPDAEPGSRVVSVKVGDADLDPDATYTLATNDFLARGGDNYTMFVGKTNLIPAISAKLMANDVMSYIRKMGTVSPTIEGRITTGM